jgi:6-phosphofructokinase 1
MKVEKSRAGNTLRLSDELETLTGLESRVTILGHVQRGGTPSSADRILTTQLGTACSKLIQAGEHGVMVALKGDQAVPVPLVEIVGKRRTVPTDHSWIQTARDVGVCLGDE